MNLFTVMIILHYMFNTRYKPFVERIFNNSKCSIITYILTCMSWCSRNIVPEDRSILGYGAV
jgi:hypothetical protein